MSMFQYAGCAQAWLKQCVVCREFAACVNASMGHLCTGMDEVSAFVCALYSSRVRVCCEFVACVNV